MYSIRTHLISFFLILIFLPVGLTSWSFSNTFQANVQEFVEQATLNILKQSLQQVTTLVKSAEQAVEYQNDILKQQVIDLSKGDNTQAVRDLLKASIANQSMLKNIGVVDIKTQHFFMSFLDLKGQLVSKEVSQHSGKIMARFWQESPFTELGAIHEIASEWQESEFRVEHRPWYEAALSQQGDVDFEALWTEPYIFEQSGEVGISFAKAINKPGEGFREPFAIAFVDISLEGISKVLQGLEIGEGSRLVLVNKNNQVLASSFNLHAATQNKHKDLQTISELGDAFLTTSIWNSLQEAHLLSVENQHVNSLQFYTHKDTEYYARALQLTESAIAKFGWTLWVFVPKNALLESYYKSRTHVYLLTAISVVLALIIALYIWLKISKQLNAFVNAFGRVQKGDFKTPLSIDRPYTEFSELTNHFNKMLKTLRENTMMQRLISKTAHKNITQNISLNEDEVMLKKGERTSRTLLFSDIRGFTAYSENKEPEEVVSMLNKYLGIHAEVIEEFGGDVDKYVGDEVMATFEGKDAEVKAIRAAIKICNRIAENTEHNLTVGIGINSGQVVTGYIGSEGRAQYTSIGNTVNYAARLCSKAGPAEIWVSETVYNICHKEFHLDYRGDVEFKGFRHPQKVYLVNYK